MNRTRQNLSQGGQQVAFCLFHNGVLGRMLAAIVVTCLLSLTGCGFFPPVNSGSGSGGGSGSTTGSTAYVANYATKTLQGFSISTTGQLTSLSTASATLGVNPLAMAITPGNTFLYVGGVGGIYAFSIGSTGALTVLNSGNAIVASNPVSLDISPDGNWLFDLESDGVTFYYYGINSSTGLFTSTVTETYGASSGIAIPRMVKVAPTGNFVALALGTGGDLIYTFNTSTGALNSASSVSPANTTTSDNAVAFDATGAYLYAARSGASAGILSLSLNAAGVGTVVSGSPFAAGNVPYALQLDSTGKYLYCANRSDGTISAYTLASGVPTAIAGSAFNSGSLVSSLTLSTGGTYLLAASYGGGSDLTLYTVGTTSPIGALTQTSTIATGTDPVEAIAVVATH